MTNDRAACPISKLRFTVPIVASQHIYMGGKSSASPLPRTFVNNGKGPRCTCSFHDCDGKEHNDTISCDTYREAR
jgi:hypothetical protein